MSRRSDRINAARAWHMDQTALVLNLIDRNRRIAAIMQECVRLHGGGAELEAQKLRFWARALNQLQPTPGQPTDTALNTGDTTITKRASSMRYYGRCTEITRERWGVRVRFAINCREVSPAALRKAFAKVDQIQLRQMRNPDLRPGGCVLRAEVLPDGIVELSAVVVDPDAALKVSSRAYTGCLVAINDGEITDISLVDSPVAFEKRSQVLAKLFSSEGYSMKYKKLSKQAAKLSRETGRPFAECAAALEAVGAPQPAFQKAAPPLPASAVAALNEVDRTENVLKSASCESWSKCGRPVTGKTTR